MPFTSTTRQPRQSRSMSATAKSTFGDTNGPEGGETRRPSQRGNMRSSFGNNFLGSSTRERRGSPSTNALDRRGNNASTKKAMHEEDGYGGVTHGMSGGIASGIRERYGLGDRATSGGAGIGASYLASRSGRYGSPSMGGSPNMAGSGRRGVDGSGVTGGTNLRKKYQPQGSNNTSTTSSSTRMEQHFNNHYGSGGLYTGGGTAGSGSGSGKLTRPFKDERHYQSREGGIDKNKLRICVRIRPSDKKLNHSSGQSVKSSKDEKKCVQLSNRNPKRITVVGSKTAMEDSGHDFAVFEFDKVFAEDDNQAKVYKNTVKEFIPSFLAGKNVCCMGYGQTGAGKTHTLIGEVSASRFQDAKDLDSDASGVSSLSSCGVSEAYRRPLKQTSAASRPKVGLADQYQAEDEAGGWNTRMGDENGGKRRIDLPGVDEDEDEDLPGFVLEETGMIPRLIHDITTEAAESIMSDGQGYVLHCSYVEVHKDSMVDLLETTTSKVEAAQASEEDDQTHHLHPNPIRVKQDSQGKFCLEGATEALVPNPSVIIELLERGNERRVHTSSGKTAHHAVFIIKGQIQNYAKHETKVSYFSVVDLAASDVMAAVSYSEEMALRDRNGRFIFNSLSTLGDILSLYGSIDGNKLDVPSNSSKLGFKGAESEDTMRRILQLAFQHVSKACLLLHVSPTMKNVEHTYETLHFGHEILTKDEDSDDMDEQSFDVSFRSARHKTKGKLDDETVATIEKQKNKLLQRNDSKKDLLAKMAEMENQLKEFSLESDERSRSMMKKTNLSKRKLLKGVAEEEVPASDNKAASDLDAARDELNRVTTLLRSAAQRMEEEMKHTRDEMELRTYRTQHDELMTHLEAAKEDFKSLSRAQHSIDRLQASQVSRDSVSNEVSKYSVPDEVGDSTLGSSQPDTGASSRYGALSAEELRHKLRKRERMLKDREKELTEIKKENSSLVKSKKKRDDLLAKAKKEMRVLLNRVNEAELHLKEMKQKNGEGGGAVISNSVRSAYDTSKNDPTTSALADDNKSVVSRTASVGSVEESVLDRESQGRALPVPIRACLRLRPLSKLEISRRSRSCIEVHDGSTDVTIDSPLDGEFDFHYDQIFDSESTQNDVYEFFQDSVVADLFRGMHCCVAAYGLASSGRTFTLMGELADFTDGQKPQISDGRSAASVSEKSRDGYNSDDLGIAHRLTRDIFREMRRSMETIEFTVKVSYVALYLEQVLDLLDPQSDREIFVTEDDAGVQLVGVNEAYCFHERDVNGLIRRGQTVLSMQCERLGMNDQQLHSILIISVEQRDISSSKSKMSKLYLADIACARQPKAAKAKGGVQQEAEKQQLNRNLTAFPDVIKALSEGKTEAPYMDTKLTSVLKEAFGGNCKTSVLVTASPSSYHISDTLHSVRLGNKCRTIVNHVRVQEALTAEEVRRKLMMSELKRDELKSKAEQLESELKAKGSPERRNKRRAGDNLQTEEIREAIQSRMRAESLLTAIQSEVLVLRRQNALLVKDRKVKEDTLVEMKRDLKVESLRKMEVEHKFGACQFKEREAVMFTRHLRKLCWRLQKDLHKVRSTDISEITSQLSGTPDLSGLIDLDSMLMEAGFISNRELEDKEDDAYFEEYLAERNSHVTSHLLDGHEEDPHLEDDSSGRRGRTNGRNNGPGRGRAGGRLISSVTNALHGQQGQQSPSRSKSSGGTSATHSLTTTSSTDAQSAAAFAQRERQLERDLRAMTQKCVELNMQLKEERANLDMLTGRGGNINQKRLTQELLSLQKERDQMMNNAKAAAWKLEELHAVNNIMYKKAQESQQQVQFLEEGFQRLQETFRSTALDSLDGETKLREEIARLEVTLDALTMPEGRRLDAEVEPPQPRINLTIRGQKKDPNQAVRNRVMVGKGDSALMASPLTGNLLRASQSRKGNNPKERLVIRTAPLAKFRRPSRKLGNRIGGRQKNRFKVLQKRPVTTISFEATRIVETVLDAF